MAYNSETGMYEGYIYKIINDVDDKVYIGQTRRTVNDRWKEHKKDFKHLNYHLYNAMKKYGIEHFSPHQIEKIDSKEIRQLSDMLDNREIFWIEYYNSYNNGYNQTSGGQSNAPNRFPERHVIQYTISGKFETEYPSVTAASEATGFSSSDIVSCCLKTKVNRVHNKIFRYVEDPITKDEIIWYQKRYPKIYQYDVHGNLINTYEFIKDAIETLANDGIKVVCGNISKCCHGGTASVGGYVWRKHPDNFNTYKVPKVLKRIEKRDINTGKLLETFDSYVQIHKKYGYNPSVINNCCHKRIASSQGYHWCFEGEFDSKNLSRIRLKPVTQYSTTGEFIKNFNSADEAAQELGINTPAATSGILGVCNGKYAIRYGYVWRYSGEDFNKYSCAKSGKGIRVNQYDLNGVFIQSFDSYKQAAKSINTTSTPRIRECCLGERKSYKGFLWFHVNDQNQPDKNKIIY